MNLPTFIILLFLYSKIDSQELAVVKQNHKYGCIDRTGNFVIEPIWDYILQDESNKTFLVQKDSLYGYIDVQGKTLIYPKFKEADVFSEGLASVSDGKVYGFINIKGDTVIPFQFDDFIIGFSEYWCDVCIKDSCGYINKEGQKVIDFKYKTCYPFMNGYGQVQTFEGKNLIVDKNGKEYTYNEVDKNIDLWRPRNTYPGSFQTKTGQGRINDKGDTIVPPIYKYTWNLKEEMYIVVSKEDMYGAYDYKGSLIINPQFEKMGYFNEGVSYFKKGEKYGFIDKKGRVVIKPIFDEASEFSHGLAYVEYQGKGGFIDKKGKFIISPRFQTGSPTKFR